MLFGFCDAGEGGGYEGAFEVFRVGRGGGIWRVAGRDCEGVYEFEDEEAGEGAAEVGDAVEKIVSVKSDSN